MKELKHNPIINTHFSTRQVHSNKRWAIAQSKTHNKQLTMQNSCVEAAYIRIIKAVKNTFLTAGTVYYDYDSRRDKADGLESMHTFITPDFYLHLQCNFYYEYEVVYAFGNCAYEGAIREMFKPFPLDRQAKPFAPQTDYDTFFAKIIARGEHLHTHTL